MITAITGPMFGGKTTYLCNMLIGSPGKTLIITSTIDTRRPPWCLYMHNGRVMDTSKYDNLDLVCIDKLPDDLPDTAQYHTLVFAEAQFMSGVRDYIVANRHRHDYIVEGLCADFRRQPFGDMPLIRDMANVVVELRADCATCGQPASHTALVDKSAVSGNILVGESEYEPRCGQCHL